MPRKQTQLPVSVQRRKSRREDFAASDGVPAQHKGRFVLFCRALPERLGRQWKRREDSYCGQNDAGCLSLLGGKPVGNQQSESRAKKGARSRYENQFRNGECGRFHTDASAYGAQLRYAMVVSATLLRGRN